MSIYTTGEPLYTLNVPAGNTSAKVKLKFTSAYKYTITATYNGTTISNVLTVK